MYKFLKPEEALTLAKENLLKQEKNIEVLEQSRFTSKVSALPSLKIESFILFENNTDSILYIAQTDSIEVNKILTVDEFKDIMIRLPNYEQVKLKNITNKIEQFENKKKNKI